MGCGRKASLQITGVNLFDGDAHLQGRRQRCAALRDELVVQRLQLGIGEDADRLTGGRIGDAVSIEQRFDRGHMCGFAGRDVIEERQSVLLILHHIHIVRQFLFLAHEL